MGGIRRPEEPSYPCTSLPQIPQAATRISTSPATGSGVARSVTSKRRYCESKSAFMILFLTRWNHSASLTNGENLVRLYGRESFSFLRCRPLHLNGVDHLRFAQPEVEAKVALRHDA